MSTDEETYSGLEEMCAHGARCPHCLMDCRKELLHEVKVPGKAAIVSVPSYVFEMDQKYCCERRE